MPIEAFNRILVARCDMCGEIWRDIVKGHVNFCVGIARKAGWKIDRAANTAICPQCASTRL